jgi:hypothetical protein
MVSDPPTNMNSDAKSTSQAGALPTHDSPPWWRTGVIGAVLDFFTNVKLGIWLMVLLFIYSSIGSAGIVYPEHPNIL